LTILRARIASRMVESKTTVPHFYVTTEIDMAAALALRKQINETLDEAHKVSVNDMVIKATALTLRNFPNLNSHYYGDKIVRYAQINIGIAVALDGGGLMNVVAKDADRTAISVLAARNKEMIASARSGKVKPADIEGSTFTVSNLGAYDVEHFIAIINPPEAGILAVGSAQQIPVVINGELKIGTRMKVTISVDHRVSDGAEGAQFLQAFKKLLENPMRLLI
jgi:pyruvate dehydrogenase E2 component (dihydrolipoamide acetyltransferase)